MCSLDDHKMTTGGLAGGSVVKNCRRCGFGPWVRKIPQRRKWQPLPVFLPGKSHGQRSYSPWGHKESDTTEAHKQQNDSCSSKNSQDLHIEGKKKSLDCVQQTPAWARCLSERTIQPLWTSVSLFHKLRL